jgi:hypothetical protein
MAQSLQPLLQVAQQSEHPVDPEFERLEYLVDLLNTTDDPHEQQMLVNEIWQMLN